MEPFGYIISLFYSLVGYTYFLATKGKTFDLEPFKTFWHDRIKVGCGSLSVQQPVPVAMPVVDCVLAAWHGSQRARWGLLIDSTSPRVQQPVPTATPCGWAGALLACLLPASPCHTLSPTSACLCLCQAQYACTPHRIRCKT